MTPRTPITGEEVADGDRGFGKMARQIGHYMNQLEMRSNTRPHSAPGPADKTAGYLVAEVPDWQLRQWFHIATAAHCAATAARQQGEGE